ncbi:uncharacterized protein LOC114356356 [Ostrinia furnacalis]|uniref:uncharacterized protein LOC114356356 n=1 Tax=Ostrinia furnacalis TaxID=93504 RepID=UPI00103F88C5|nr:uncharacterized protein LOC114356356 [Ostrinia furnacalis]
MLYESGLPVPRAVPEAGCICHTCWVAADRAAVHMISGPSTSSRGIPPEEIQPETQHTITDSRSGMEAILKHYCNCIVGRQTVGCCAHIMSIICRFLRTVS